MEKQSRPIFGISVLFALGFLASAPAKEGEARVFQLEWKSGLSSLGLCIERGDWILAVIPKEIESQSTTGPTLEAGKSSLSTEILYFDPIQRLCLLQTESVIEGATPMAVASSPGPRPGDTLTCCFSKSKCQTTVAGKEWSYRGKTFQLPLMRVRLADPEGKGCKPGTPLFNKDGEVEGLITEHTLDTKGEALAIPASRVRKLVRDVKKYDRSGPVWIGLVFHNHSSSPEVIEVKPDSPASEAGIEEGDVILSVNDEPVQDLNELSEIVLSLPAGEKATVEILRGLKNKEVTLVPQFAKVSAAAN